VAQDFFCFFGSLPPPPTSRMGLFCNGTHFYIAHLQSVLCCNATNCSILTKNAKHQGERVHAKEGGEKLGGALRGWVGVRDEWESEKASKRAKVPRGDVETGVIIPAFEPWTHSFLFFSFEPNFWFCLYQLSTVTADSSEGTWQYIIREPCTSNDETDAYVRHSWDFLFLLTALFCFKV